MQPTMPVAPLLSTIPEVETDFMIAQSENALEVINRFQEEEEKRLREILEEEERQRKKAEEAALLARQKAAEEEAKRKREAEVRAIAAREEAARRAQEQAVANREAEARRAQERAVASREAEARRARQAQEQAVASREAEARRARQAQEQALAARQAEANRAAAANAAQARRVASGPAITKRSSPKYPSKARSQGLQGTTQISATITTSGKVSSPRVVSSSGHSSLDSAALKAVKKWRFKPATNGLGQAIAHPVTIPVTFRLN